MEFRVSDSETKMTSFGVVGRGKTGQAVIDILGTRAAQVFSRANPLDFKKLADLQALIVFVPADALALILPNLIESGLPVVCGTTGFTWPANFSENLKAKKLTWIAGSNFSPGMNFFFSVASLLKENFDFLGRPALHIQDLHHAHKKDSPSGTALKLQAALGNPAPIHAERVGEHPGLHELTITSELESLTFRHEAKSRRAFAEGAVYAAETLLPTLSPGLHSFESLMKAKILNQLGEAK
jgi:4-hydroxy-tetrahydrodipicolinate reductase